MDIGFEVIKDGELRPAYVECKYRKDDQGRAQISKYMANAKIKNSVSQFLSLTALVKI